MRWMSILLIAVFSGCSHQENRQIAPEPRLDEAYEEVRSIVKQYKMLVEKSPDSAVAWGHYGMVLDAHEYSDEAIPCYRNAVRLAPQTVRWRYFLARRLRERSPEEALEVLKSVSESREVTIPVTLLMFELQKEVGRDEESELLLQRILSEHPNCLPAIYQSAIISAEKGDSGSALLFLDRVRGRFTETELLRRKLKGELSVIVREDLPGVESTLANDHLAMLQAFRRDPLWTGMQYSEAAKNGDEESVRRLVSLVQKYPEIVPNRLLLALYFEETGQYQNSEKTISAGLAHTPEDVRLLRANASLAISRKDWPQAEQRLLQLLTFYPKDLAGLSDLSFVLESCHRLDEAMQIVDRAERLGLDSTIVAERRNSILEKKKRG